MADKTIFNDPAKKERTKKNLEGYFQPPGHDYNEDMRNAVFDLAKKARSYIPGAAEEEPKKPKKY